MQMRGEHRSGSFPPDCLQVETSTSWRAAVRDLPGMERDRDRRWATERAAERRRDLAGPRRTYGNCGETEQGGATVSGRRLSKQAGSVPRRDPFGGFTTPAPAT